MSTPNDSNKVVDLQQRQAAQAAAGDRVGDLLKAVRGTSLKRVNALVNTLFENIDDALFDLAEKAENNSLQTQYFDGMREVRKKRQLVERLFQDQLGKIFNDFAAGKLLPMRPELGASGKDGGLALLEETELEESLAIASMVAKAENRLTRSLFAVNQRLSVISGGIKVEDANNPIGPAPLCQACRIAVKEFDIGLQVKLIIYKLFDRYVMGGLEAVYEEVNAQLIQAGVLPQLRRTLPGGSRPGGTSLPPGMQRNPAAEGMIVDDGSGGAGGYAPVGAYAGSYDQAAHLQAEIYSTLRGLLASRRSAAPLVDHGDYAQIGVGGQPLPAMNASELLSALTMLQNQTILAQSQANSAADAMHSVQQLKQELLDQAGKFNGERKAHVSGADEDTIDLVGMLFEFILQDRNLPPQMQALIGRLQIPFLKVAILDKHLFAQKSHPARQLLDAMAHACVGWSEESDRDHRLLDKVKQVVETLLKDFDDDLNIFDRVRSDFDDFVENNKKRAELAEQRAAEATRGREKLHAARRTAAKEILKRTEAQPLPEIIRNVLTRPWANYLVLTLLRLGEDSTEWKGALRFADEFVWSAAPKTTDAERTRLKGLLPVLEKSLRHGLATVAYHDNDVKQLMHELNVFYQRVLSGDVPALPQSAGEIGLEIVGKPSSAAAAAAASVEEIVLSTSDDDESAKETADQINDQSLAQAKEMKVGTWVEFTDPSSGNKERAKLSWISPISSKYLFVNRKGLKVSDKTVSALAVELRRGSAVILEEVPLFDRALDAIVERLKSAHSSSEKPSPA